MPGRAFNPASLEIYLQAKSEGRLHGRVMILDTSPPRICCSDVDLMILKLMGFETLLD